MIENLTGYEKDKYIVFVTYQSNRANPKLVDNIQSAFFGNVKLVQMDISSNIPLGFTPQKHEILKTYADQSHLTANNHVVYIEDQESGEILEMAKKLGMQIISPYRTEEDIVKFSRKGHALTSTGI